MTTERQATMAVLSYKLAEKIGADGRQLSETNPHRAYTERVATNKPGEVIEHIVEQEKMLPAVDRPLTADTTAVFVCYGQQVFVFMVVREGAGGHVILPTRIDGDSGEFDVLPWRYHVNNGDVSMRGMTVSDEVPEGYTVDMVRDLYSLARAGIEHGETILKAEQ
jgi:hypothetical protein